MRALQFDQIMRDAEVANAIWPVIVKYHLNMEKTTETLLTCGVPRAGNVARIAWHSFANVPPATGLTGNGDRPQSPPATFEKANTIPVLLNGLS